MALATTTGCSGNTPADMAGAADMHVAADLVAARDLTTAPACDQATCGGQCVDLNTDALNCGACGMVCPMGETCRAGVCAGIPTTHRFVMNSLRLPASASQFAYDLNGDGKADNQLGNIVSALTTLNLDAQGSVDNAVSMGTSVYLLSVKSSDPVLSDDAPVAVTLYAGVTQAKPDFSGAGMFTVDMAISPGQLTGALVKGVYNSESPVSTKKPVTARLSVALLAGQPPILLILNGAHIQFTTVAQRVAFDLSGGELHGSVKSNDVNTIIIPAIASLLTAQIKMNPFSAPSQQIQQLFDTGGCKNPNGTMAQAGDMIIDVCEVATNAIVQGLLQPDVQIFDANGSYAPSAANTKPDSLSVGLGFSAVTAKF